MSMGYDPPRPGLSHAGAPLPGGDLEVGFCLSAMPILLDYQKSRV